LTLMAAAAIAPGSAVFAQDDMLFISALCQTAAYAFSVPLYIGCILSRKRRQSQRSDVIQSRIITGWITLIMLLLTVHVIAHLQFFRLVLFTHGDDPEYAGRWSSLHVATNTLMVATALCVDGMMAWRCYIVWSRSKIILLLSILTVAATCAMSSG